MSHLRVSGLLWPTACLFLSFSGIGCRTTLPRVDLKTPGWTIHEGQAVWRSKATAPEIAGDLLLATSAEGSTFVQFSKSPFPLLIAQSTPEGWQVEVPTQNERHSGRGRPPKRIIMLYLPRLLSGAAPPRGWSWEKKPDGSWRLENEHSGESLEGYFNDAG